MTLMVADGSIMRFCLLYSCSKVIEYAYNGCGDTGDEPSGHGTHVSGTIVGNMANANIETSKSVGVSFIQSECSVC